MLGDFFKEMDLLAHLGYRTSRDRELKLQWLDLQAHQIVKRGWRQVCDVAQALLERQTLSGDELRDVVLASIDTEQRATREGDDV